MEEKLFKKLKERNVSDSSAHLYIKNLERLNGNCKLENLLFLKDKEAITARVDAMNPNTARTYYISITSCLKDEMKYAKRYKFYYDKMMDLNEQLKVNNNKSEKQEKNWITQDDVVAKFGEIKDKYNEPKEGQKLNSSGYTTLLELMVLSLYVLAKPRRNLDYMNMVIVKSWNAEMFDKVNYLDLQHKKFIFNNFKTQKTYKTQIEPIGDELYAIIELYMKHHANRDEIEQGIPFLVRHSGDRFTTSNSITRILNKIFDKNIGASMLRNIYLTSKFGNQYEDLQNTATAMGTSVSTIQNNYIKTDK